MPDISNFGGLVPVLAGGGFLGNCPVSLYNRPPSMLTLPYLNGAPVTHIHRSALVAHSDHQMFQLVNDIEAYPHYMDGCIGAEVLERSETEVTARLDLSKLGMRYSFTTRNHLREPEAMDMRLIEGPFKQMKGLWSFHALADNACKVSLDLEFEFSNRLVAKAAGKWFESVANELVDGLCRRAQHVYG